MNFDKIIRFPGWSNVIGNIIKPGEWIAKTPKMAVRIGDKFKSELIRPSMFKYVSMLVYCVTNREICPQFYVEIISDYEQQCKHFEKFRSNRATKNRRFFLHVWTCSILTFYDGRSSVLQPGYSLNHINWTKFERV